MEHLFGATSAQGATVRGGGIGGCYLGSKPTPFRFGLDEHHTDTRLCIVTV